MAQNCNSSEDLIFPTQPSTSVQVGHQPHAGGVRLTLATELGHDIDGALWPRSNQVSRELSDLIEALNGRLGDVVDINVNWASSSPPSLTFYGRMPKCLPVMTIRGTLALTRILIVPHGTPAALAMTVLLRAAYLPAGNSRASVESVRLADNVIASARDQCAALRQNDVTG